LTATSLGPHGATGTADSSVAGLALIPGLELGLLPALDGLPPVPALDELPLLAAPEAPAGAPPDAPAAPAPAPPAPPPPPEPEPCASAAVTGTSSNATASRNDKTVFVFFLIRSSLAAPPTGEHECGRGARSNGNATVRTAQWGRRPCGRRSGVA